MRFANEIRSVRPFPRISWPKFFRCLLLGALVGIALTLIHASGARSQSVQSASGLTIVLPPRVMAGHPATLAILGADGKLAVGVRVDLSDGQSVTTDRTGRALFDARATGDYVLARSSGALAAALIDPAVAASEPTATTLPTFVSIHDRFWICGAGLRGDADSNDVKINGQPALVMAASPICLVALPPPDARPGPAAISIEAPGVQSSAMTTLVSLEFESPKPALKPGEKGQLTVQAQGSDKRLPIVIRNESPTVLKFVRGDVQELVTSGGSPNFVAIRVQAITSGAFSFSARVLQAADTLSADRYLRAATPLAPKESRREVSQLTRRLASHSHDADKVRAKLDKLASGTGEGDFRALLDAARAAL